MKRGINKPWQDNRSRHYGTDKIRQMSGSWNLKTWQAYADSLEKGTEGVLMTSRKFRQVANSKVENIFDVYAQTSASNELVNFVNKILEGLTTRQAHAVDLVFFEGKSLEEAGQIMGLGKTTVYDHLQRALSHLRAVNAVRANDLIIMRGQENSESEPLTREEEILEVFNEESRRGNGYSNRYTFDEED